MKGYISAAVALFMMLLLLAIAPNILTANTTVANNANITGMIGMTLATSFGGAGIVILLLVGLGSYAWRAFDERQSSGSEGIWQPLVASFFAIFMLTIMDDVVDYIYALITASTGIGATAFTFLALGIYCFIIYAVVKGTHLVGNVRAYRHRKKGKRGGTSTAAYGAG